MRERGLRRSTLQLVWSIYNVVKVLRSDEEAIVEELSRTYNA